MLSYLQLLKLQHILCGYYSGMLLSISEVQKIQNANEDVNRYLKSEVPLLPSIWWKRVLNEGTLCVLPGLPFFENTYYIWWSSVTQHITSGTREQLLCTWLLWTSSLIWTYTRSKTHLKLTRRALTRSLLIQREVQSGKGGHLLECLKILSFAPISQLILRIHEASGLSLSTLQEGHKPPLCTRVCNSSCTRWA